MIDSAQSPRATQLHRFTLTGHRVSHDLLAPPATAHQVRLEAFFKVPKICTVCQGGGDSVLRLTQHILIEHLSNTKRHGVLTREHIQIAIARQQRLALKIGQRLKIYQLGKISLIILIAHL